MLFGLQAPAQLEAAQIAAAHARLQRRMEDDPNVTTMQPGGVTTIPPPAFVNGPGGYATPPYAPPQQRAEPFVWGQGGARLGPDMIAQRSRTAQGLMAGGMDTSPVGHWTQGLARVAQALIGRQEQRKLDRASAANTDARSVIMRELTKGSPDTDAVTAAVSDVDPVVRELGQKAWALQHPKPEGPSDLQQRVEYLNKSNRGLGDTYATNYAANGGGAPQVVTTPQGTFMVPRSPAATTSAAPSPSVPDGAVSFLRSNPDSAGQFDAKYGAGASARYLQGGAAPQAPAPFATR